MYNDLVYERHYLIDGVDKWIWPISDHGAWNGPHKEWPFHKKLYLKYSNGFNCALGEHNSRVTVIRNSMKNVGMHQVAELENSALPQVTIDSLNLQPSMISLDVEGYEPNIIRGAMETIKTYTPLVVCERGGDTILNILKDIDSRYFLVDKRYEDYYYVVKEK